jgi:hypothetical protein
MRLTMLTALLVLGFVDAAMGQPAFRIVAPELRFVYGAPARIGNKHREAGFGARATWRF